MSSSRTTLREAILGVVLLYCALAVRFSSLPYEGAQRHYGYSWEHSLQEWSEITELDRHRPPEMRHVFGWVNIPRPYWHEEQQWVDVPAR